MNWHLYKKDDLNTWPDIDCPMLVYYPYKQYNDSEDNVFTCHWDNDTKQFYRPTKWLDEKELYYAYIGYVPCGYKTCYCTRCAQADHCEEGYDDNGYCMSDSTFACEHKIDIAEYSIEMKAIWKEFE